jgi:aminomethyltransferase
MSLKKTPLHGIHKSLQAKMADFAGFEMPIQYSSIKNEVARVRENAGVFDVSHMGEFFIEGPDAVKFVDYLITNDFSNSDNLKAVYSPLCRENGTIIDDLIAYKLSPEKILICVNASNIEKDWDWISKQKKSFNVELSNRSGDYSLLAIQGPQSADVLGKIGILSKEELAPESFPYYSIRHIEINDDHLIIARTGYTGEDGFEIFSSSSEYTKTLWEGLSENGATPCGLAARDVLRLEVCYPLYGHELNDEITPLDSALKWTVKMDKKDFLGKDSLSSYIPKYRLVKLSLNKGIPREGYPILNNKNEKIGKVTSGTLSVVLNKGISLGLVEKNKFPEDKKFFIQIRNKTFEASYQSKPFYKGGHK